MGGGEERKPWKNQVDPQSSTQEEKAYIKRNEIELYVARWMDLESVIQSEVSQKEKNKYHMLTHIYGIFKKMVLKNLEAGQE